jgi:hypothetical protein
MRSARGNSDSEYSNSSSRAGGGGSRGSNKTLSSIGINLSPGTTDSGEIGCRMAQEFYNFLLTQGETFVGVSFNEVPTVTMEQISLFKRIGMFFSLFEEEDSATIDADNNVILPETFCFDDKTQMNTGYLINEDIPGVLTMTGVTKDDEDNDIVWYALTCLFEQDPNIGYFVTIDGFCKNNRLQITGSRIGVELFLMLCEQFNNKGIFNIKYCSLEPLKGVIEWWKLFGFYVRDYNNRGPQGGYIMTRDFPDSPAPAPPISLSSDPANEEDYTKDQYEFELIQSIVPEDLEGETEEWRNRWGDSDYDDVDVGGSKTKKNKKNKKKKKKKTKRRRLTKVKRSRRRSRLF